MRESVSKSGRENARVREIERERVGEREIESGRE